MIFCRQKVVLHPPSPQKGSLRSAPAVYNKVMVQYDDDSKLFGPV